MRKDVGRRYVGRARQLRVQCNMGQHSRKPLAMRTTHLRFLKIVKKDPQWASGRPTSAALLSGAMSDSNKFMAFHLLRERRGYLSVSAMVPYLTQMLSKLEM
jgi:hypothetical protein